MQNSANIISLKNVSMSFGKEKILNGINLDIKNQEFVTFLGPSGCGKTTTLRIIGGFLNQDSGDVFFNGKNVNNLPANKRQVNTIFQNYALFPHLNVFDNVAFGLRIKRVSRSEIKKRVHDMLALVNLKGFEHKNVTMLSGGQQQRVAIARALINNPQVLLLDEPLSALDKKLRKDMQVELKNIQQKMGITFIFVTHDQEEALSMSDTVVVMNDGEIQQIGTPKDIYYEPSNAFVADFIGESNILHGKMLDDYKVLLNGVEFDCLDHGFKKDADVDIVIRPEDIKVTEYGKGQLRGEVTAVTFKGIYYEIIVDIDGFKWMIQSLNHITDVGDKIGLIIIPDAIHIMAKSKYSDEYGDYSTFSDEILELGDASLVPDDDREMEELADEAQF